FVGPPLFHGLGLTSAILALGLGSTLVLRRRFDAALVLDDLERHRCTSFVAVPVMLSRLLAVPGVEERDLSRLRVVMTGGARLDPSLAGRVRAAFGPVLYNFYGSTEASCITIATPADLAAAPGCVGRPPAGTTVAILGHGDRPVPPGATGRIFVDTPARFGGYTGGGGKEEVGGLMAVGDLGHLDEGGRLHVDGRADDMIVSGGENVHPGEVEDLLAAHPAVEEAAVVGVPDEEFGQRLRAYVVLGGNGSAGGGLTADEVKSLVAANLARHKVPRDVVFLDRPPRNPAGKVLQRALPLRAPRPRPGRPRVGSGAGFLLTLTYVAATGGYRRIPYRRCGRSGLLLPAIPCGRCHDLGDDPPLDVWWATLRRAFDMGLTHFYLANNFGPPYGSA